MNEKRFESYYYGCEYYTEIVDKQKQLDLTCHNPSQKLTITEAIDMLNQAFEANEFLNDEIKKTQTIIDEQHERINVLLAINNSIDKLNDRLKKENAELKDKIKKLGKPLTDDEIRRLYSEMNERIIRKASSGNVTYTLKTDNQRLT